MKIYSDRNRADRRHVGRRHILSLFLLTGGIITAPVQAQELPRPPSGTFEEENRDRVDPVSEPRATFRIERPSAGDAAAASDMRFDVRGFRIVGASVIAEERLQGALAEYAGQPMTLADIYRAADALTKVYADAGYALSFALVPVQDVADGIVVINIIEGTVDAITVEIKGSAGLVGKDRLIRTLERRFAGLINSGPVKIDDIERAVLNSRDLGGMDVTMIVRPSKRTDGAASLLIVADLDPIVLDFQFDDRLRSAFGDYRSRATLRVNSMLIPGDQLIIDGRTSIPTSGFVSGFVRYQAPIGSSGLNGTLDYSRARSRGRDGLLDLLDFEGNEEVVRAGVQYPIQRTRTASTFLNISATAINSESGFFGLSLIDDNIRTVEASLSHDWASEDGSIGLMQVSLNQGLKGLGATERFNLLRSRSTGRPDFTSVTSGLDLRGPIGVPNTAIRLNLEMQAGLHGAALAASECNYGGDRFGRAFDFGALGGEHCLAAMVEVTHQIRLADDFVLQPFMFADAGKAWQSGRLDIGEARTNEAWSAGLGARLALPYGLSAEAYAAWPGRARFTPNNSGAARFFFTIGIRL